MADLAEFERYMNHLSGLLGHADRQAGFIEYGRGLMLPIERKSVEPLAAHTDPWHVSSKHQSLHHMVAKSEWSDEAVLGGVREWVSPGLKLEKDCYWIGGGVKKNSAQSEASLLPEGYTPRGSRKNATPRSRLHRHTSSPSSTRHRAPTRSLPVLRTPNCNAKFVSHSRDSDYSPPPVQIRTCAVTHTAPTLSVGRGIGVPAMDVRFGPTEDIDFASACIHRHVRRQRWLRRRSARYQCQTA